MPFLTYPLALLAAAALPALAAIYILRNRYRRREVSSLMLWQFAVLSREGGAKVNKLQLPLVFFLELLALALLVTAATGPRWQLPAHARPLVVILDDSASMLANASGAAVPAAASGAVVSTATHPASVSLADSPRAKAAAALDDLLKSRKFLSIRLVLAGPKPRVLGSAVNTATEVREALAQWTCQSPDAALDAAIALANDLGGPQSQLLVLTDHAPPGSEFTGNRIQWRAFGSSQPNLAFVNATRTTHGDADRVLLEVANYSASASATAAYRIIALGSPSGAAVPAAGASGAAVPAAGSGAGVPPASPVGQPSRLPDPASPTGTVGGPAAAGAAAPLLLRSATLTLEPRARQRLILNLPAGTPAIEATLAADALAADNRVTLLPAVRKRIRVQNSIEDAALRSLVDKALDATGLRSSLAAVPEIILHNARATPAGTNAWGLRLLTHTNNSTPHTGPFIVDTAHPLTRGLALDGVVWTAPPPGTNQFGLPIVTAGNTPLLSATEDALGRQQITLHLVPDRSTLTATPNWPILFWNLLTWRARETPGLVESNFRLGSEVSIRALTNSAQLKLPNGTTRTLTKSAEEFVLEPETTGLHTVTAGASSWQFTVNLLAPEESDLSAATSGKWGEWERPEEARREYSSVLWLFVLGALVVMVTHLFLVTHSKGRV